jgi:hypothetical protein
MWGILVLSFIGNMLLRGQDSNNEYLLRSTTGVQGTSQTVQSATKSYLVQQSIGQTGITGTVSGSKCTLRQGFIQSFIESEKQQSNTEDIFDLNIEVSPNPFSDHINICFSSKPTTNTQIMIHNIAGQGEYTGSFQNVEQLCIQPNINTNGIYLLKVIVNGHSFTTKIIKN